MENTINRVVAEAIGTFVLVFSGTFAIAASVKYKDSVPGLGVAVAFAVALLVMVYAIGHISGCHINPAVSLGLALQRKIDPVMMVGYWIAQIVGALIASACVWGIMGSHTNVGVSKVTGTTSQAFWAELIATFLLVFVVSGAATDDRAPKGGVGLAIGGALLVGGIFAGPFSGGSMNPARSIAPAIIAGQFGDLWLYIVAPLIGGAIGGLLYAFIQNYGTAITAKTGETE